MNTFRLARERCLSRLEDESVKELIAERDALLAALTTLAFEAGIVVANATMIPDPLMNGTTDCWRVPLGDIENLHAPLTAANAAIARCKGGAK